jgi:hypothetical protein
MNMLGDIRVRSIGPRWVCVEEFLRIRLPYLDLDFGGVMFEAKKREKEVFRMWPWDERDRQEWRS